MLNNKTIFPREELIAFELCLRLQLTRLDVRAMTDARINKVRVFRHSSIWNVRQACLRAAKRAFNKDLKWLSLEFDNLLQVSMLCEAMKHGHDDPSPARFNSIYLRLYTWAQAQEHRVELAYRKVARSLEARIYRKCHVGFADRDLQQPIPGLQRRFTSTQPSQPKNPIDNEKL